MDFVCKLYGNTYAVHVTVALVGVATLILALPAPPEHHIATESLINITISSTNCHVSELWLFQIFEHCVGYQ